jgi:hypothetical protein
MNLQNGHLPDSKTEGGQEMVVGQRGSVMGIHDEERAFGKSYLKQGQLLCSCGENFS